MLDKILELFKINENNTLLQIVDIVILQTVI